MSTLSITFLLLLQFELALFGVAIFVVLGITEDFSLEHVIFGVSVL